AASAATAARVRPRRPARSGLPGLWRRRPALPRLAIPPAGGEPAASCPGGAPAGQAAGPSCPWLLRGGEQRPRPCPVPPRRRRRARLPGRRPGFLPYQPCVPFLPSYIEGETAASWASVQPRGRMPAMHREVTQMTTAALPTLFVPHGAGPCFFMDWEPADAWVRMERWLRAVPELVGVRPTAVLVVSGHWEAPRFTVNAQERPPLLYDYHGF